MKIKSHYNIVGIQKIITITRQKKTVNAHKYIHESTTVEYQCSLNFSNIVIKITRKKLSAVQGVIDKQKDKAALI